MSPDRPAAEPGGPLAAALRPYLDPGGCAATGLLLAVSGGPDSTALMHAAARLGSSRPIHVATVDHGLRRDSCGEAQAVGETARSLGLPHRILTWTGEKPAQGIQAAARKARYDLLAACARDVGADMVLTGHTADDQAETVLMRLLAGSGPAGLAGMKAEREMAPGLCLARPFLTIAKADLVAYCAAHGLAFLRDPSNADERFARARLRRLIPDLAREGLTPTRLCRLAVRSARDEAALADAARTALAAARQPCDVGLVLDGRTLAGLPEAILLRVVDLALDEAGGGGAARLDRLERLVFATLRPALVDGRPVRATLRGILVDLGGEGSLSFGLAPPRRTALRSGPKGSPGTLAAGSPDLLGKPDGTAYIAGTHPC